MHTNTLATHTQLLLDVGYRNNWEFILMGKAPIPTQPIRVGDWLIVDAQEDQTRIPRKTMHRIQTVYAEGVRPESWVLVHEAPYLLSPPKEKKKSRALPYLALLGGLGVWLASSVITAAAIVDPILIAITSDLDWVEIDRWYD